MNDCHREFQMVLFCCCKFSNLCSLNNCVFYLYFLPPPPPHTHTQKKNVASLFSVCIELYVPFLPVCKDKFIVQQVPFITHHTHFQIIDYSRIASINGKICCRPSWFYGICCRTPQKRVFTTDHASLKLTCQNILWSLF